MSFKYKKIFLILCAVAAFCNNSYSQFKDPKNDHRKYLSYHIESTSASFLPISILAGSIFYLINPEIMYENKKLYAGITKEFSIGFGKFGEHRFGIEYSLILGGNIRNHLRFSYKYDLLLKTNIQPSNTVQGTSVVSFGAGYFTDFGSRGAYPEITYGYSLRNDKFLIYPHVKLRHTFMFDRSKSDNTDLSFGIIFGIANPFIDVNIRNEH
jgi:hypothetical protein